jgi:transcriptional regulator with XRE-family HTH domain
MRIYPNNKTPDSGDDAILARRLEEIRNDKGLSLAEVAALSGISRATLSRIERGETSPTANALGKLCSAYKVTMSRLLSAMEADSPRLLKFSDAKKWLDPDSGFTRVAISPPTENYNVEVTWGQLAAGSYIHYDAPPTEELEQHLILLEGELKLTFDDIDYEMKPMDCLALKLHGASKFRNLGRVFAKYLVINSRAL